MVSKPCTRPPRGSKVGYRPFVRTWIVPDKDARIYLPHVYDNPIDALRAKQGRWRFRAAKFLLSAASSYRCVHPHILSVGFLVWAFLTHYRLALSQGFLTVYDIITGNKGLNITSAGATITGDSSVDGSFLVTGTCACPCFPLRQQLSISRCCSSIKRCSDNGQDMC